MIALALAAALTVRTCPSGQAHEQRAVALLTRTVVGLRARRERRSTHWGLVGGPGQVGLGVRGRY